MIDPWALQAASEALACIHQYNGPSEETDADARRIIEAYEAAKPSPWRPIADAPRDGSKICVWWAAGKGPIRDYPERMEFLWWERDCWISDLGGRALTHSGCVDVGAMFRTICPPKQDAVSQATSTPPAAEASS